MTLTNTGGILQPLFAFRFRVLFDHEINAIFVRGVEGVNADDCFADYDLNKTCAASGAALAAIHRFHFDGLPGLADEDILSNVADAHKVVSNFDPARGLRLDAGDRSG